MFKTGYSNSLSSKDSIVDSKLIGLDFSFDFGSNQTTYNRELFILNKLTSFHPFINNFTPNYNEAYFNNSYNKVNVDLVFRIKPLLFKKQNLKQELRFGLSANYNNSLMHSNASIFYDSIASDNVVNRKYLSYNYRVFGQQIGLTYIINTKVFAKNFASYFGLGTFLSLNTFKGSRNNNFSVSKYRLNDSLINSSYSSINIEHSLSTTSYAVFIPLGLKYNFSCEINLFLDLKFGLNFTPKFQKSEQFNRYNSLTLGFRYKLNQKDVLQSKQTSFW